MHKCVSRIGLSLLGLVWLSGAHAVTTVTGQISSTLTLTSSCLVNGASGTTGLNFGALNFGTTTSLFTEADAQVLAGGGGALSIQCSASTSPTVKVRAGTNDRQSTGGTRALFDGVSHYVPYDFYTDAGHQTILAIDDVINLSASAGAAQTVNLYGKAVGKAGLPAGVYTDTVAVELSF